MFTFPSAEDAPGPAQVTAPGREARDGTGGLPRRDENALMKQVRSETDERS